MCGPGSTLWVYTIFIYLSLKKLFGTAIETAQWVKAFDAKPGLQDPRGTKREPHTVYGAHALQLK